jgi:hypothetical protein
VFEQAQTDGIVSEIITQPLIAAKKFLSDLMSLLRLSAPGGLITDDAPTGLKNLLCASMRTANFDALKEQVITFEANVSAIFERMSRGDLN